MKKHKGLPAFAGLTGALALCGAAHAQAPAPVTPADLDRTQFQASARAMGMGGTDLIVSGDVSGAAFNPASVGAAGAYSETQTAVGRTSNVHVAKINDLSHGLKDLGDQFNNADGSLAPVRDAFQKVYNFATSAGANDRTGSPATLSASLAPLVGFSVKNVGLVAYGTLAAQSGLAAHRRARRGSDRADRQGLRSLRRPGLDQCRRSLQPARRGRHRRHQPRASRRRRFAAAGFLADETDTGNGFDTAVSPTTPNGNIVGATYKEVHQQKFDMDLGFTSIPDPVYHIQGAIVVHNLLSPTYHLPRIVNGTSLGVIPPGDFDFQMKPQIDLGGLSTYNHITYAAELHNLGNVNGGKRSVHLGVEYPIGRTLSLRGRLRPKPLRRRPRLCFRRCASGPRHGNGPAAASRPQSHLRRALRETHRKRLPH